MICSTDVWLILDTNILADIFSRNSSSSDLITRLKEWAGESTEHAIGGINNRRIIFVVSTEMLHDYKTGLGKRGFHPNLVIGMELLFERSPIKIPITNRLGTFFLIPLKIHASQLTSRVIARDKYDTKLCTLAKAVFTSRKCRDQGLILGCRDRTTANEAEKTMLRSRVTRPFIVARDTSELEEGIRDN